MIVPSQRSVLPRTARLSTSTTLISMSSDYEYSDEEYYDDEMFDATQDDDDGKPTPPFIAVQTTPIHGAFCSL